jgi:hypothetical protein
MRWFLPPLVLLASLLGCQPSSAQQAGAQQVYCGRSFVVSAGATSITQAVAGVAGQVIAVCGVDLNAGAAAGTFQLTVGTGTNCNTNTTNITPVWSLGINGVMTSRLPVAYFTSPSGYQLCYTITGTGPINALVTYHQYGG